MNTTAPATERNGVPTDKLFGTIAKLKENGDLAAFRFGAKNEWINGTASQSTIHEWYGAGADHVHVDEFTFAVRLRITKIGTPCELVAQVGEDVDERG